MKMEMIDNVDKNQDKISQLAKRDVQRKLDVQKQKDQKESQSAKNEEIDYFLTEFNSASDEVENLINTSSKIEQNNLHQRFDEIFKSIANLQKYVANSSFFVRTYDIKRCNKRLQELNSKAKDLELILLPKKKFGFSRKSAAINNTNQKKDEVDFKKVYVYEENIPGFCNKFNEKLILKENVLHQDITLHDMQNCEVKILSPSSTLHINALNDCLILCGPVSTSIFIENCENCTFVIACQQLRLHASKNIKLYLHVTSRAIMEDCNSVTVAPFNFHYDGIQEHFQQAGLNQNINNWQSIDDFNWLNISQHSPNWNIMEENERTNFWD